MAVGALCFRCVVVVIVGVRDVNHMYVYAVQQQIRILCSGRALAYVVQVDMNTYFVAHSI